MTIIRYFAYGSNLLTPRLRARCPSARAVGAACAPRHRLTFAKPGADGSGKANILSAENASVFGAVFEIDAAERAALDVAESGYRRIADFEVELNGVRDVAFTYIAQSPAPNLVPFDWYLALVVAGAREHGIHPDYIEYLRAHDHDNDGRIHCKFREAAQAALTTAGYANAGAVLRTAR